MRLTIESTNIASISPAYQMEFCGASIHTVDLIIGLFLLWLAYAFIAGWGFNRSISRYENILERVVIHALVVAVLFVIVGITGSRPNRLFFFGFFSLLATLYGFLFSGAWPAIKKHFFRACRFKRVSCSQADCNDFDSAYHLKYHDWLILPTAMALVFIVLFFLVGLWYSYSEPTRLSEIARRMEAINRKKAFQEYVVGYSDRISFLLFEHQIDPSVQHAWNCRLSQHLATTAPDAQCKGFTTLQYFASKQEDGLYSVAVHFELQRPPFTTSKVLNYGRADLPVPEEKMLQMVENQLATGYPKIHDEFNSRKKRVLVYRRIVVVVMIMITILAFGIYYTLVSIKYHKLKRERQRQATVQEAEARRRRKEQERQWRKDDRELARFEAEIEEQIRKKREWEQAPKQRRCRKCDFVFPEYSIPRCPNCNSGDFEVILA